MKTCTGCKVEKDNIYFGKVSKNRDGLNEKCKECCKARAKLTVRSEKAIENQKKYRSEWQKKKRPILNARLRDRYVENIDLCREQARIRTKRYLSTEHGKAKHLESTKMYVANNKEKISAQRKIRKAVLSGKIIRPEFCQICGKQAKTNGHHEDYERPLEVIWMCSKCHLYHHQQYRFYRERLNEKDPKGYAKVCSTEETCRGGIEESLPPS